MPGEEDFVLHLKRSNRGLVVELYIGEYALIVRALLGPNFLRSAIAHYLRDDLIQKELLPPMNQPQFVLPDLRTLDGRLLPEIKVGVLPAITRFGFDMVLGLDFFAQFSEIHFYWNTLTLVLVDP